MALAPRYNLPLQEEPTQRRHPTMYMRLALLGFGNVHRELARLLLLKAAELEVNHGFTFSVTGIASHSHGSAINPDGLDLNAALEAYTNTSLDDLNVGEAIASPEAFIARVPADVLLEATWMNPQTGQPATDYCRAGLERGQHVITANKGPLAFAYRELRDLARGKNLGFFFESTVMGGGPVHSLAREGMPSAVIATLRGILNSTTNSILTRLAEGVSFDDAVREAQEIGVAEADPSNDVDGWDATVKIVTLANVHMGADLRPNDVDRTGIREVTVAQAQAAAQEGKRIKLVCEAWREGGTVKAKVAPVALPLSDPLANISGTGAGVTFSSDMLHTVTIIEGPPSGPDTTAYGMMADLINVARGRQQGM